MGWAGLGWGVVVGAGAGELSGLGGVEPGVQQKFGRRYLSKWYGRVKGAGTAAEQRVTSKMAVCTNGQTLGEGGHDLGNGRAERATGDQQTRRAWDQRGIVHVYLGSVAPKGPWQGSMAMAACRVRCLAVGQPKRQWYMRGALVPGKVELGLSQPPCGAVGCGAGRERDYLHHGVSGLGALVLATMPLANRSLHFSRELGLAAQLWLHSKLLSAITP